MTAIGVCPKHDPEGVRFVIYCEDCADEVDARKGR